MVTLSKSDVNNKKGNKVIAAKLIEKFGCLFYVFYQFFFYSVPLLKQY